jgi:hypothetical protein
MIQTGFNIFSVLEKDNKEMVHSAFLRFLMQKDGLFYTKFLGLDGIYGEAVLERQYSYTKHQKGRFDIEAQSTDGKSIVVIENKFKSFPYPEQFDLYDKILKKHHKGKKAHKFLICFDKRVMTAFQGWIVKDYSELLIFIETNYNLNAKDDVSVFIRHYYFCLTEYFQQYESLKQDFRYLLHNPKEEQNKFWLKLFYSELKLKLDSYFLSRGIQAPVYINAGNTQVPLLNILPFLWKVDGRELLIQFQGNDLKFYSHCPEKDFLNDIIAFSRQKLVYDHFEYKKLPKNQSKTYFILKTKVTLELPNGPINVDVLFNVIIKFYNELDQHVIGKYYSVQM